MKFNSAFVYTPYLPPNTSSAALRGQQLLKFAKTKFNTVKSISNKSFYTPYPTNQDKTLPRLVKEILCGLELFFRVLFSKSDYYIFSSPPFFIALLGSTAALLKNSSYLFDIRDLYPQIYATYGLVSHKNILYRLLINWSSLIYKRSHNVTTVTKSLLTRVENQSNKSPLLIRNGYDSDISISSIENKHDKFSCVYHGNLGQFQRIDLIIKIAKELPNINFYIAGDGPKKELLLSTPENIKYLGLVSRKEVLDIISKCHLGLSFLDDNEVGRESFPVKVYEFIGCGIPTVVTPIGEASNELNTNRLGRGFNIHQVKDICKYITSLSDKGPDYSGMAAAISEQASQYSRDHSSYLLETQVFEIR